MGFKLEGIWYAVLFLGVVMIFGFGFFGANLSKYQITTANNTKLGVLAGTLKTTYDSSTLDMKDKLQGGSISDANAVDNMVKAGYTASRNNPFTMASIGLNATQTIITESNLIDNDVLPLYTIFWWALTITIIFGIIYLIMRYRAL